MKKILNHLKKRFLTGLFVILPIGITAWILIKLFNFLDSILGDFVYSIIDKKIPGLGILFTIVVIILVGILTSNILGKQITLQVEKLLKKIPIIKAIYGPIRDITGNFGNENSNNFKKAVFATYPMEGSHSIGFITKEDVQIAGEVMTVIFIPTTPNPTSGVLVYLTRDKYIELDIPVDEALKAIVSLGSASPDVLKITK